MRQDPKQRDGQSAARFVVRGVIDGRPSVARWVNGRLVADRELVRRAQVMVGMGEYFGNEHDPSHVVMASLEGGGYDVMLTVMRAFSRVTSVELPVDDWAGRPIG
jgi:hypothetical protein